MNDNILQARSMFIKYLIIGCWRRGSVWQTHHTI